MDGCLFKEIFVVNEFVELFRGDEVVIDFIVFSGVWWMGSY